MAGGEACRMDDAKRAARKPQLHRRAVIGVQSVVANLAAGGLVKSGQPGGDLAGLFPGDESGEVEDMDADIAQHAFGAMGGGEPPEPLAFALPIAPSRLGQPALQIAGLKMP